jgi:ribonuclease D
MSLITDSAAVAALCERLSRETYVTVDTEFLRENTYWPILCVVQIGGADEAVAIDALAEGMDLQPVLDLMANPDVLKVFHAARQDIEIFVRMTGQVPAPLFDTQIAAMVCGFGDQVGYETLVSKLAKASIDKSSRFTDWSARPLTEKQIKYALSDVIHLRPAYEKLNARLERTERSSWLAAEMETLADPGTYQVEPRDAWKRLKIRSPRPRFLAVLQEVAAWREETAKRRDQPRNRVVRDEALVEIAAHPPADAKALARVRGLSKATADGNYGKAILSAVQRGLDLPEEDAPTLPPRPDLPKGNGATVDLLRVLLKMRCDQHEVAQKLVASASDLELIAAFGEGDVRALSGWRRDIFGEDALALRDGRLALMLKGGKLDAVPLGD